MIAVCITTYNEEASIASLVKEFAVFGPDWYRVYLVDDGSTDDTVLEAFNAGAHKVFQTGGKWGIGPSLMHAWGMALEDDPFKIIQIDAGGSHDPRDILSLAHAGHGADLVIGSRFLDRSNYTGRPVRSLMSRLAGIACNWAVGSNIKDWTSGYRIFSPRLVRALLQVPYTCKMHGWQIEVLGRALELGVVVREAPISYIAGRSSFNFKIAREAFVAWRRLIGEIGWPGSNLREIDL